MVAINRSKVEEKTEADLKNLAAEDLSAVFFNKYGHKFNDILHSLGVKQIRRALINAFGFQHKDYSPKPETDEGKLWWAMEKLVAARTAMFLHMEMERANKAAEEENLENKIINQENNIVKQTKGEDNGTNEN